MIPFYGAKEQNGWSVVYKKAIEPDGSLLFPQKLTAEFLKSARRTMGSYLFANQYMNEIIPDDERRFKPQWNRIYETIPSRTHRFAFVDPAIGQKDHHDFTAIVLVETAVDGTWYVRLANRYRLTPAQIVSKLFELQAQYPCQAIGVESVAYQEALLYMLAEEMRRRQVTLPVKAITRSKVSKEVRILGLVPRFEWGTIFLANGLTDLQDELALFPRASHDDLLDALASIEEIAFYPQKEEKKLEQPNSAAHPDYERWYIQNLSKRSRDPEDSY